MQYIKYPFNELITFSTNLNPLILPVSRPDLYPQAAVNKISLSPRS